MSANGASMRKKIVVLIIGVAAFTYRFGADVRSPRDGGVRHEEHRHGQGNDDGFPFYKSARSAVF